MSVFICRNWEAGIQCNKSAFLFSATVLECGRSSRDSHCSETERQLVAKSTNQNLLVCRAAVSVCLDCPGTIRSTTKQPGPGPSRSYANSGAYARRKTEVAAGNGSRFYS